MDERKFCYGAPKLCWALLAAIVVVGFYLGARDNTPKPTPVEACAVLLIEDMRQHAEIRRALRDAQLASDTTDKEQYHGQ